MNESQGSKVMAQASLTKTMPVAAAALWQVIEDYAQYPKFVDGVSTAKIISSEPTKVRVEYAIELMGKKIHYTLDHFKNSNGQELSWSLVDSNLLKANSGHWQLKSLSADQTEVTYHLELEFNFYVPGMILNQLVKSSLPRMMDSFQKQAMQK